MFSMKRSHSQSKSTVSRYSSKGKDASRQSTSRQKSTDSHFETESGAVSLPLIKQSENTKVLPKYTTILQRSSDDGVSMDDLDQLQQDFEKLLSTCSVRNRLLRAEVESIDKTDYKKIENRIDDRRDKKGKVSEKPPLKRKKPDDKLKYKETKNGSRLFKPKQHGLPINSFGNDVSVKHEVSEVVLPRNETSDKFWLSIDPYCADVVKHDVNFLDELIQECSQDINVKIPELGEHYASEWAESALNQEQNLSTIGRPAKTKSINFSDIKKNGLNAMMDTFSSPLTQRLLATLIEEKVVKSYPTAVDKLVKASDFTLKNNNGARGGMCLDKRLRKELIEQGILDAEDLPKTYPTDDGILQEIKKCQQELAIVNEHNIAELKKLRTLVAKDLRKQEIKAALNKVDTKVTVMYNNILLAKQKHASSSSKDEGREKHTNKFLSKDIEEEANKLIKQQTNLHEELWELTNISTL